MARLEGERMQPLQPADGQTMNAASGAPRVEDMMRARAETMELDARRLRDAADEIERARMSGGTLDVLRGMFWRSV